MKPQASIKLRSEQSPEPVPSHGGPAVMTIWELTVEDVRIGYEIMRHKWCDDRQKYASIEHAPRNLFDTFKALCERLEEPHRYLVGDRTMKTVFAPNVTINLSNLQAVLDAVEKALEPPPDAPGLVDQLHNGPINPALADQAAVEITLLQRELEAAQEALRMISAEAKEPNEPIGRSVFKALATCGEIADLALSCGACVLGEAELSEPCIQKEPTDGRLVSE